MLAVKDNQPTLATALREFFACQDGRVLIRQPQQFHKLLGPHGGG